MAFREMNTTPFSIFHILKQKSQLAFQNHHHQEYARSDYLHTERDFVPTELKRVESSHLNNNELSSLMNIRRHAELVHSAENDRNDVLNNCDSISEQALAKSKDFIQRLKRERNLLHESPQITDETVKEYSCSNSSDIDHSSIESQNNTNSKDTDKRTFSVTSNEADSEIRMLSKNLERNMHSKLNRDINDEHSSEEHESYRKFPDSSHAAFRQHTFQHHFDLTRFGNCDRLNELKLHPYKFDVKPNVKLSEYDSEHQDAGNINIFISLKLV